MATQLLRQDQKSKSNWTRLLNAANKLDFEDGELVAGKGWKIEDMDANTISTKLSILNVEHSIKDKYTVIIN